MEKMHLQKKLEEDGKMDTEDDDDEELENIEAINFPEYKTQKKNTKKIKNGV